MFLVLDILVTVSCLSYSSPYSSYFLLDLHNYTEALVYHNRPKTMAPCKLPRDEGE
jgi:hypothetical protein